MIGLFILLLTFLASSYAMPVPSNAWQIKIASSSLSQNLTEHISKSRRTHIWTQYGLTKNKGRCIWAYQEGKDTYFQIYLYSDSSLRNYLKMMIHLNTRINFQFPFFNGTVHTTFQLYKDNYKLKESKNYLIQPHAFLNMLILTITENNGDQLIIQLQQDNYCFLNFTITLLIFLILKWIVLFTTKIIEQGLPSNGKLSQSFVCALCGWQLYFHFIFKDFIFIIANKYMFIIGLLVYLASSLCVLIFVIRLVGNIRDNKQTLTLFICGCFCGLLAMNVSLLLYSLILLLQIKLNIQRRQKYSICSHMCLFYLANIGFILYLRGCPINALQEQPNYYFCGIVVALVIAQLTALNHLQKIPYMIYRKIRNGKRETDEYVTLSTAEFNRMERLHDNVCSICLQPLVSTDLKARIGNLKGDKQLIEHSFIETSCNHFFHTQCIRKEADLKQKCPLDRKNLAKIQNW